MELENQPFDLQRCIEESLDLVSPRAEEKKLDIGCGVDKNLPPWFVGDVTRIRQILVNLLANAVKFTERGEVVVQVSGEARDENQYELHFAVKDTGIGIPRDAQQRIFESFVQVDASTTRRFGGTGLGLAISMRLSEMMGGRMWFESTGVAGEGTTFHFTVRVGVGPEAEVFGEDQRPASLDGKTVLIVDDSKSNREILAAQVEHLGMRSTSAASGAEALAILNEGRVFDLAMLDLNMPEMDGRMLAEAIHKMSSARQMPLVLLSSAWLPADEDRTHFIARLTKPIKRSRLRDVMQSIIEGGAAYQPEPRPETAMEEERCPIRIMLAEDNPINQKVAMKMLSKIGCHADVASDGTEVIEALKLIPYDLILMDCQMPEMDGYEATRRIRQLEQEHRRPRVHIVAMTAHALQGDREQCIAAGMDDYLSKPVRPADLERVVRQCCAAKQALPAEVTWAATPSEESPLDRETLDSIAEGDPDGARELVELFLEQAEKTMRDLHGAIEAGAAGDVNHLAHKLAGSSAACGATGMMPPLHALEQRGREGVLSDAGNLLAQIEQRLESTRRLLAEYLDELIGSNDQT